MGPLNLLIERPTFSIFGPEANSAVFLNCPFCQVLFYFEIFIIHKYLFCFICFFTTFGIRFTFERNVDGVAPTLMLECVSTDTMSCVRQVILHSNILCEGSLELLSKVVSDGLIFLYFLS